MGCWVVAPAVLTPAAAGFRAGSRRRRWAAGLHALNLQIRVCCQQLSHSKGLDLGVMQGESLLIVGAGREYECVHFGGRVGGWEGGRCSVCVFGGSGSHASVGGKVEQGTDTPL